MVTINKPHQQDKKGFNINTSAVYYIKINTNVIPIYLIPNQYPYSGGD